MTPLTARLGITLPIIQAPMAGVSTPAMAAAVSNAGALGSIAIGASDPAKGRAMIDAVRAATDRPFNANLFCHRPAKRDVAKEAAWIERLRPEFAAHGVDPPAALTEIYTSFVADDAMLAMLLETRPTVVSFHFGLPDTARIAALRDAGILLLATATSLAEGRAIAAAGIDAVVAQGHEAGGHRGLFDENGSDEGLDTLSLTRLLVGALDLPVIAAGGIMDGADIARAFAAGAQAAQLGTAFVACPESDANPRYRNALRTARGTAMTRAISGRPARSLVNRFTALAVDPAEVPAYPVAYDLGKALNAAAIARGEFGYGAQWAGEGAARVRPMPAGELVALLANEMRAAQN